MKIFEELNILDGLKHLGDINGGRWFVINAMCEFSFPCHCEPAF